MTRRILLPAIPVAALLLLWEWAARGAWINPMLYPPPSRILADLARVYAQGSGDSGSVLLTHMGTTLRRLFLATALGTVLGIAAGVAMGLSARVHEHLNRFITFLMPIPGIAMAPVFILWLGFGDPAIISVSAIAAFFPVVANTAAGLRSVDPSLAQSARIMGAGPLKVLLHVYIPWSSVYIFTGVKLGLARCWRTVVAVELIAAANWGLGYMIWDAAEYMNAGVVYGGILILGLTYVLIEQALIVPLERLTVVRWGMMRK